MYITESDMKEIKKIENLFSNTEEPQIISLVRYRNAYKVVSCRKFKPMSDLPEYSSSSFNQIYETHLPRFFIKDLLDDYIAYLDYLYINGIEEVRESPIGFDIFEILVKALVCCYDSEIRSNGENLVKVRNKDTGSMIFYSTKLTRPTFSVELLERVRAAILKKFATSKNKLGMEEVSKLLRNSPRVNMKIVTDE